MKVLVLSGHTDDGCFSMGGTIAKHVRLGHEVKEVCFSFVDRTDLVEEFNEYKTLFGIKGFAHNFEVRNFGRDRQQILDKMLQIKESYKPDLVFIPCGADIHQDHQQIYKESLRCFKYCSILGYILEWNVFKIDSDVFSVLEKEDIEKKIQGIKCFKSQDWRDYFDGDKFIELAKHYGGKVGKQYAEIFEAIRIVE